jgi:hypothetical protein
MAFFRLEGFGMRATTLRDKYLIRLPGGLAVLFLIVLLSPRAYAENRIYHLRVTLRSGERYETLSTFDPINYCANHGGSAIWLRDYSLIYSPEMKVKVVRTWVDRSDDLPGHWRELLRDNNMLSNNNRKPLPRLQPLTMADMQRPE